MIHTLFYVALWFLGLFIAFKMGQASEQIRINKAWHSTLHERGLQTKSGRAPGAPRSSSIEREMLEAPVAQSRAPDFESGGPGSSAPAGASSIEREPLAESDHHRLAENGAPSRDHAPSPSVLYDGEAEAALDPRPILSVVEGLEERPGLRVVEP